MTLRVLYVEDVTQSYDAICIYLKPLGYEILPRVTSLQETLRVINSEKPDILLVDLGLSEEGNDLKKVANFISELKRNNPKLTILVHSAVERIRVDVVRAIVAAGISYLVKAAVDSAEHLDRAIKHALTGGVVYDSHIVKFLDKVATSKAPSLLTEREWEIVQLVAEHLSNKEIAKRLDISTPRVGELITKILDKLGFSRRSEIIAWYIEQKMLGYSEPDLNF